MYCIDFELKDISHYDGAVPALTQATATTITTTEMATETRYLSENCSDDGQFGNLYCQEYVHVELNFHWKNYFPD